MHTCWRGRSTRSIFGHRETVMGLCRLPRTVFGRLGKRWRDGAGSLPILGYPVTRMLAHMLARAVDAVDFRPSRIGDGTVPTCRAQSLGVSESDGATARAVCRSWDTRSLGCLHTCWRGRSTRSIFDHRESVMGPRPRGRTVCERIAERLCDGAGSLPILGHPVAPVYVGARWM